MKSYQDLLRYVIDNGEPHSDRTGVGTCSVFGAQWRHDMRTGFPLLTTKRTAYRWVAEELFWFLRGENRVDSLKAAGVDIWDEWATEEQCAKFGRTAGDLGPIYGPLWRKFPAANGGSTDQIAQLLWDIRHNPESRRIICTGWHPQLSREVTLPPCHTLWQVKVHKGEAGVEPDEISLHMYARSIDIFLGLPFDIASYALLLELIAFVSGMAPRYLIISFGDLHLYNNHREQADLLLSREPKELPTLSWAQLFPIIRQGQRDSMMALMDIAHMRTMPQLIGYAPHPRIAADVAI